MFEPLCVHCYVPGRGKLRILISNGPFLVAVDFVWLLYGCYLAQLSTYYGTYSERDSWLKYLVMAVTMTGGLHVGLGTGAQYGVMVEGWGLPQVWQSTPWEASMLPFTTGLNAFLVQLFFAGRIALIERSIGGKILAASVASVAILAFGGALALMIIYLRAGSNALQITNLLLVTRLWTISSVVCDVSIAGIMIVLLARSHSQAHFRSTKQLVRRLIVQSIETGSVTAVVMILMLICYETMNSQNSTYLIWEYSIAPLYGNVMLFVLNARAGLRPGEVFSSTNDFNLHSAVNFASSTSGETRSSDDRQAVKVNTNVSVRFEESDDQRDGCRKTPKRSFSTDR
ncbi:hypothetical protein BD626DRAFT_489827 [Schizophyllum amplum]|uniref:DUF6534 domain-containing protein n=1 Tax=Schizophyllum amplum TaxID=97359 RepID=A0A550CIY0_9AGAR|nr:hypothetical protein BD626DRAFT_489827 [Auriculariopsis ampla]